MTHWQHLLGNAPDWLWALPWVEMGAAASIAALVLGLAHLGVVLLAGPQRGHQGIDKRPDRVIPPRARGAFTASTSVTPPRGPSGASHPPYSNVGWRGHGGHQPREKTPARMTPPKGGTGVGGPPPHDNMFNTYIGRELGRAIEEVSNDQVDTATLVTTLDALVDAGAEELAINGREARLLCAHLQGVRELSGCSMVHVTGGYPKMTLRQFVKVDTYRDVPVRVVGRPDPPPPVKLLRG